MNDDNSLVDEYENLQRLRLDIEIKIKKLREDIILLSKRKNTPILFGTNKKCSVKEYEKVVYPENKEILINTLKNKGLYERFSSLNVFKLTPRILKGEVDNEIINLVKKGRDYRVSLIDK